MMATQDNPKKPMSRHIELNIQKLKTKKKMFKQPQRKNIFSTGENNLDIILRATTKNVIRDTFKNTIE